MTTWHRNFASDRQERREAGDLLLTANTNAIARLVLARGLELAGSEG